MSDGGTIALVLAVSAMPWVMVSVMPHQPMILMPNTEAASSSVRLRALKNRRTSAAAGSGRSRKALVEKAPDYALQQSRAFDHREWFTEEIRGASNGARGFRSPRKPRPLPACR
jgi:hypothetical protein